MTSEGSGGGPGWPGGGRGSYAGIASINTSVRDNKNVLEVRLERSESARFNLSMQETESLLVKLGIDSSHFLGVSSCPEGKGVVFITLHSAVNINRYLSKQESYILKEGVKTGRIFPAGKKEVSVFISGLHPNTKDQAVIRYLAAHGKVSQKDKVIHHVFPGEAGSSLLAGKLNGDRSYMVEVTQPMGSYHIIDGEKVSLKYRGQLRTCARCHGTEKDCSGKGIARECQGNRVLLSTHMEKHWEVIGFKPDTNTALGDDTDLDVDVQVGKDSTQEVIQFGPDLTQRYTAIMVSGLGAEQDLDAIQSLLVTQGLPDTVKSTDILKNEKSGKLTIENLGPADCMALMENMHGKKFFGKKIFITPIVSASPAKARTAPASSSPSTAAPSAATSDSTPAPPAPIPPPPPPPPPSARSELKLKLKITRNLRPTSTKLCLVPVVIVEPPEEIPGLVSSSVSGSDSDSDNENTAVTNPVSPSIQDKIEIFDPTATGYRKRSLSEKRKHIESPEKTDTTLLTRAEIKTLRKEKKRLKKQQHLEAEKNFLKSNGN